MTDKFQPVGAGIGKTLKDLAGGDELGLGLWLTSAGAAPRAAAQRGPGGRCPRGPAASGGADAGPEPADGPGSGPRRRGRSTCARVEQLGERSPCRRGVS